jgi:hypothetical protein
VDHFLHDSSYEELLGFRKDSPHGDTYVFAVSLVDDFRYMMMDPSAGWYQDIDDSADDGDVFMDAQSMHLSLTHPWKRGEIMKSFMML